MKNANIAQVLAGEPWAIDAHYLDSLFEMIQALPPIDMAANIEAATRTDPIRYGKSAVIPVLGPIMANRSWVTDILGASTLESMTAQIRKALDDSSVESIVLKQHTPGGTVYGLEEFAEEVYQARSVKPVVAVAKSLSASAGYFIGSAASEFVAEPSAEVGSVGVVMAHVDQSKSDEAKGIEVTYIKAGDFKVEGNSHEALSDEAHAFLQQRVDDYYATFVGAVARNRGVSSQTVIDDYGKGRIYGASQALQAGMIDRIETFDNVMQGLQPRQTPNRRRARAELNRIQIT